MLWHNLHSYDFRIVFCCHLAFLVLAYIPLPEGRGFRLDLGNSQKRDASELVGWLWRRRALSILLAYRFLPVTEAWNSP